MCPFHHVATTVAFACEDPAVAKAKPGKGPKGECKMHGQVVLSLRWLQQGPDKWKLRGSCPACRTDLGIVKQTDEALAAAPSKIPQTYLFGEGGATGGSVVEDAS